MAITPTGRIACGGRTYAAPLVRRGDIRTCTPTQELYDLACTSDVVNCLLFRKQAFLAKKNELRALLAQAPAIAEAATAVAPSVTFQAPDPASWGRRVQAAQSKLSWCRRVVQLVEDALADTNIQPAWLLGGDIPTRPDRLTHTATLPPALWAATYSLVADMYRAARAQRVGVLDVGRADATQRIQYSNFRVGIPTFWAGQDFEAPLGPVDRSVPIIVTPGGTRGIAGVPNVWSGMRIPDVVQLAYFHFQSGVNYNALLDVRHHVVSAAVAAQNQEALIVNYWVYCTGRAFYMSHPGQLSREALRVLREDPAHAVPGTDWLIAYCKALIQDVLVQPFEVYVLYGLEQWAGNMAVWAQNGYIDVPVERFRQMAEQVISLRGSGQFRLAVTSATGLVAGVASAVNPVAGAAIAAVGLVINLLLDKFGAIGGWYCPLPLTLRSATGACDFSRVVGEDVSARAGVQTEALSDRARADLALEAEREAAQAQTAASAHAWFVPALTGVVAFGVGLGIAALARRT